MTILAQPPRSDKAGRRSAPVPGQGGGRLVGVGVDAAAITSGPEEPFCRHSRLARKAMAPNTNGYLLSLAVTLITIAEEHSLRPADAPSSASAAEVSATRRPG